MTVARICCFSLVGCTVHFWLALADLQSRYQVKRRAFYPVERSFADNRVAQGLDDKSWWLLLSECAGALVFFQHIVVIAFGC